MTQELTAEQAAKIFDIESYKAVTGYERFKRTKEEMILGLSQEEALRCRLAKFQSNPPLQTLVDANKRAQERVKKTFAGSGEIIVRIRPAPGVDRDYFEYLPKGEVIVHLDNKVYGWFDVKLGGQFSGEAAEFFQFLLENGLGEAIDHPKFTKPEEEHSNT